MTEDAMAEPETVGELLPATTPDAKALTTPAPAVTPMALLQIATEKGADLAQLEKLMELQERWEANDARKAFVAARNAFKADPPTVYKTKGANFESKRTGDVIDYDYAPLHEVVGVIAPALSVHGLSHSWSVSQSDGRIAVTCTLTHEFGHSESVTLDGPPDGSGKKNPIQQIASTVTYLERYTLLAITGLAAKEQDNDGFGAPVDYISAEQKDQLIERMKEVGADPAKFLAFLNVPNIDSLPAIRFDDSMACLNKKAGAP